jgi:hypothetical protein
MSRYRPMETEYGWIVAPLGGRTDTGRPSLEPRRARGSGRERLNVIERGSNASRRCNANAEQQREALEEIVANLSVPSHPAAWVASALKVARERLAALPND